MTIFLKRLLLYFLCPFPLLSLACESLVATDLDPQVDEIVILSQLAIEKWQEAQRFGHEWSSIQPLLEAACMAVEKGDLTKAASQYRRARQQAELAIEQARHERAHWQQLVPY